MLGQRKHKTFNYKPRFSKAVQDKTAPKKEEKAFATKWRQQTGHKVQLKGILPVRTLILLLVLLLLCMYVLEKNYL